MTVSLNKKTGKWDFCIDAGINPLTGKRKQIRRRGFATKSEALDAHAVVKFEVINDNFLDTSSLTYARYMENYMKERKTALQRPTFETHMIFYNNNIKPRLGNIAMQKMTHTHVQTFVNDLSDEGYSSNTVHLVFRVLSGSFKKAVQLKIVKESPCENISLPRRARREINVWTLDQVNYFLREAPHVARITRCLIGFQIGLLAGLRQGEILGLRWKDVDFERSTISVRQTVTQAREIKTGAKNDASIRSLTIPQRLVDELKMHKHLIEWEKPRCRTGYRDHDLVLPTRDGSPMHPRAFRKEFYNLTERLDLPKIRFHDTRHTHATILLGQNVNVKLIAERLGHVDIQTTLNTYAHVLPNMQKVVSDKLDEILDF